VPQEEWPPFCKDLKFARGLAGSLRANPPGKQ
jgi:hypothetical protein